MQHYCNGPSQLLPRQTHRTTPPRPTVMKALVPSSSGISTPSAATKDQDATAGCDTPALSTNSRPLVSVVAAVDWRLGGS
jgi:hypothetical protein